MYNRGNNFKEKKIKANIKIYYFKDIFSSLDKNPTIKRIDFRKQEFYIGAHMLEVPFEGSYVWMC